MNRRSTSESSLNMTELDQMLGEAGLRQTLEDSGFYIFFRDVANDQNLYFSPEAEKITGIPFEQWHGKSISVFRNQVHPDDRHLMESIYRSLEEAPPGSNKRTVCWKARTYHQSLGYVWIRQVHTRWYDDAGESTYEFGIAEEITDRVAREQALVEALATRDKYLGIIIHDLRNPLTVLKGYLSLLSNDHGNLTVRDRNLALENMTRSCHRLETLLRELLDFEAIQAGALSLKLCKIDVRFFLEDFHETHAILGRTKEINVDLVLEENCGTGLFDPARIEQVLGNLLSNALKYSKRRKRVVIRAKTADPHFIYMEVQDNGIGISEEDRPLLFEPFERLSNKPTEGEQSVGLGLAICDRIIKAHGGEIEVHSEPGSGSTFRVKLPRADTLI